MFYTIYKTTNNITKEFYIGQHKTKNPNDNYYGSGRRLLESIKKYGKSNFTKEILFIFDNKEDMNNKEMELVNKTFLLNPLVLNIKVGGFPIWGLYNTVVVLQGNKFVRIKSYEYDPKIHITPATGTITVYDVSQNICKRIPTEEYHKNKSKYKTGSTGRVSVLNVNTKETSSIKLSDYNLKIHKKVLGGIVSEVNGKLQYVTKEEFKQNNLRGCHVNKVTVLDKLENKRKHVTREEFYKNLDRYSQLSKGKVVAYDNLEKRRRQIPVELLKTYPERYAGTTTGYRTVWDIRLKKYINIPKNSFDRKYHRLPSDKHIVCYNPNNEIVLDFWGSKKEFVKLYGYTLYDQALLQTVNFQHKNTVRYGKYIGGTFKLLDWKKSE